MKRKVNIVIPVLLVLLLAVYCYREFNRERKDSRTQIPAAEMPAAGLVAAFEQDPAAASRYFGQKNGILRISGRLKERQVADNGWLTLVLGSPQSTTAIRCAMDTSYAHLLPPLSPGDSIVLKGLFNGYKPDELGIGADIELNYCVLEQKIN